MMKLLFSTPALWAETVLNDMDSFLIDHAAAEKKASGMAISMLSHYPDKPDLVKAMVDLSIEEMTHFRQVVEILYARGLQLGVDTKDAYVNAFRKHTRPSSDDYLLDRLIVAGIIEARGQERFGLIAQALPQGDLKGFYRAITESEARHADLFIHLAESYFDKDTITQRLKELLEVEAQIVEQLPIKAALH